MTSDTCPQCHGSVIAIRIEAEQGLTLKSCSHCDLRMWDDGGRRIPLDEVIAGLSSFRSTTGSGGRRAGTTR